MKKLLLITLISAFIAGCNDESTEPYLPAYEGPSGAVIVVMENHHWNGSAGITVRKYLEQWQMGLPYPGERMFTIVQKAPAEFSKILKVNRNIIVAHIKSLPQYETPVLNYNPDLWAKEQVVFQIYADSPQGFSEVFNENGNNIVATINLKERERLQSKHASNPNGAISENLKKYNINLTLPIDFDLAEKKDNFIWIKRHRLRPDQGHEHDISEDIFIYFYDYTDTNTFTVQHITDTRDSIGKYHVPGEIPGSYMATSYDDTIQLPFGQAIDFKGNYAMEVRGLSKLVNSFRGGPFISLTIHDPIRNRIVVVDGMVHAPQFEKREYLREIEAMVYSLEILE